MNNNIHIGLRHICCMYSNNGRLSICWHETLSTLKTSVPLKHNYTIATNHSQNSFVLICETCCRYHFFHTCNKFIIMKMMILFIIQNPPHTETALFLYHCNFHEQMRKAHQTIWFGWLKFTWSKLKKHRQQKRRSYNTVIFRNNDKKRREKREEHS